jgi:hypothetical protein
VADPIIGAIDRFFDAVDGGVGAVDRALNRTKQTEDQVQTRRAKRAVPNVIDVEATSSPTPTSAPSNARKLPSAVQRYRIVESIAPDTGTTIFIVTNGSERAECPTRALAEKILHALETS